MNTQKLGKPTDQRLALLNNQVSDLLWYGRIETTLDRAKQVARLAEKCITIAINGYTDVVTADKTVADEKSKDKAITIANLIKGWY